MKLVKRILVFRSIKINNQIKSKKIRLTGIKGEQIGICNTKKALIISKKLLIDLVEISSKSTPPVCRIMNYGKFIYKKKKNSKKNKKNQKNIKIKEIKFRPCIQKEDLSIKIKKIFYFLKKKNKVKITMRFMGREIIHKQIGIKILNNIKNKLSKISYLDFFSKKIEGRQMIMILSPLIK